MSTSASAATDVSRPTRLAANGADLARQVTVVVSAVLAIVGTAIGVGAFGGTPIAEAAGGALSADATFVAPAGPAFAIWTPIYAGLVAYAVWQAAPSRRADARQRRVGWWFAASMLLNAAWILVVQAGWLVASVAVIVVLLAVLVATWAPLLASAPRSRVEAVVLDGTVGVYLGWVSIATVADVAATLLDAGWGGFGLSQVTWAQIMLVVAGVLGALVGVRSRGRVSYAAALAWGLAWIAVGRSDGGTVSGPVATVAALAAFVVLLVTLAARRRAARVPASA